MPRSSPCRRPLRRRARPAASRGPADALEIDVHSLACLVLELDVQPTSMRPFTISFSSTSTDLEPVAGSVIRRRASPARSSAWCSVLGRQSRARHGSPRPSPRAAGLQVASSASAGPSVGRQGGCDSCDTTAAYVIPPACEPKLGTCGGRGSERSANETSRAGDSGTTSCPCTVEVQPVLAAALRLVSAASAAAISASAFAYVGNSATPADGERGDLAVRLATFSPAAVLRSTLGTARVREPRTQRYTTTASPP